MCGGDAGRRCWAPWRAVGRVGGSAGGGAQHAAWERSFAETRRLSEKRPVGSQKSLQPCTTPIHQLQVQQGELLGFAYPVAPFINFVCNSLSALNSICGSSRNGAMLPPVLYVGAASLPPTLDASRWDACLHRVTRGIERRGAWGAALGLLGSGFPSRSWCCTWRRRRVAPEALHWNVRPLLVKPGGNSQVRGLTNSQYACLLLRALFAGGVNLHLFFFYLPCVLPCCRRVAEFVTGTCRAQRRARTNSAA